MNKNLNLIFERFKESYSFVKNSQFSQSHKILFLENLEEDNKSLVRNLFGDKGVRKFEKLLTKEL